MATDIRVTGQLRLVVLKARHLQNRRKLEKQNPYVTLRIGHIVESTSVDYRGGQTPHWDSEAKFELTPEVEPVLQLSILDETKKTPTLIAEKTIDITPAFSRPPTIGYDNWYKVEYAGKEAGEIFLEMTFYPTAPKVPAKVPIKNRMSVTRSSSSRPLPTIPGQEPIPMAHHEPRPVRLADDVMIKSFSSSAINRKHAVPPAPAPETIPLDGEDMLHRSFPSSKTEANLSSKGSNEVDLLFSDIDNERGRRRSGDFTGFKKFANKFQTSDPQADHINNIFKKRPFSSSPKKKFLSRFGLQQPNHSNEDDFDLLEQQVQSDWEKNHPNEFQDAINRRFAKKSDEEDGEEDKTSSWTRSISSLNKNKLQIPTYVGNHSDVEEDDDDDEENVPLPPPKSNSSSRSGNSLFSTHRSTDSTDYDQIARAHHEAFVKGDLTRHRKPPPSTASEPDLLSSRFSNSELELPYSADSIGTTEFERSIYLKSQKLPKLPDGKREDEVFQSRFNAPKPDQALARKFRLEAGVIKEGDLGVDPGASGYRGAGEWGQRQDSGFSPSRFKPKVPAKVPIGLTEEEYYVIDRKRYLKDLNGRRA